MTVDVWADWRTRAACKDDPDRQFPENRAEEIAAAKQVCASCPVKAECLRDALALDERDGVWGGLTSGERRNLRLYGVAVRHVQKSSCPVCERELPLEAKGLQRHKRWTGETGWLHCPGSWWKP